MPIDTREFLGLADLSDNTSQNGKPNNYTSPAGAEGGGASKWSLLFEQHPEGGGPFGGRDKALFTFVAFLRAKSVPFEAARQMALWWNDRYCFPAIESAEVLDKVSRGWVEWQQGGMEDVVPSDFGAKTKGERVILTADELLDMEENGGGMEWLIPNVFAKGGIHFVSAPAAGAKSWLMLDLSRSIASGDPWLGQFEVGQGSVLYVDEEMGQGKTGRRVKQLGFGRGLPFFYLGKQGIQINDAKDLKFIVETCRERQVQLVCLDTLTGVRPGLQENESSHVSQLRQYFNAITETGATLLVAHHDRKGGQGESEVAHYRMAGSRDFGAMADMAYGIEKKGTYYHLSLTKNRLLSEEDALEIDFILEDNEDKTRVTLKVLDASERSDKILDAVEKRITEALEKSGKLNTNSVCDMVHGTKAAVIAALARMTTSGEIICEKVGNAKFYSL